MLDIDLPWEDDFSLCQRAREVSDLPIMFLPGYTEEQSRVKDFRLAVTITSASRTAWRSRRFLHSAVAWQKKQRNKAAFWLGLAITRAIVLEHGVDIAVESAVGVGCAFSIKSPLAEAQPQ